MELTMYVTANSHRAPNWLHIGLVN